MAKQMILSFDVENQTLKRKDENKIVEKSKNYVHAIFFFTEEWDDTQKAAIIENGGMRFKVYLENNECDIPNRAVSHDGFTITIVGEDEEKNITITTTDLFIAVQKNNASDIQEEYIKNITSDTLDLTREGENCNIEIPDTYKNCYEAISSDMTNFERISNREFYVTLSEKLENVITTFKQNIYVDWENQFPEMTPPIEEASVSNYKPTQIAKINDYIYYIFSAICSMQDTTTIFHKENNRWVFAYTTNNYVNFDLFNERTSQLENEIGEKSKVVANPTLSGYEETLEGAEIDGIKYKVGGGKLYLHNVRIGKNNVYHPSGTLIGTTMYLFYSIVTSKNTPLTFNEFMTMLHLSNYGSNYGTNVSGSITVSSNMRALNSFSSYSTNDRAEISYIDSNAVLKYTNCVFDSVDMIEDTITEV